MCHEHSIACATFPDICPTTFPCLFTFRHFSSLPLPPNYRCLRRRAAHMLSAFSDERAFASRITAAQHGALGDSAFMTPRAPRWRAARVTRACSLHSPRACFLLLRCAGWLLLLCCCCWLLLRTAPAAHCTAFPDTFLLYQEDEKQNKTAALRIFVPIVYPMP